MKNVAFFSLVRDITVRNYYNPITVENLILCSRATKASSVFEKNPRSLDFEV